MLICKDVDDAGRWYFASGAASGKGRDLAINPYAALSFWWPQVASGWTLYALTADEAEFWPGEEDRRHVRLRYRRSGSGSGWARELLWP